MKKNNYLNKIYHLFHNSWKENFKKANIGEYASHFLLNGEIKPDSVIVDLGANRGVFYSLLHNEYHCSCYAVEASPFMYDLLPAMEGVKTFNYAICNTDGPVNFFISENSEASSLENEIPAMWGVQNAITITGITLEEFIKREQVSDSIDVLKIDIEGAELDVLENTTSKRLSGIKQITIEFHGFLYKTKTYNDRMNNCLRRLKKNGFLVIRFSDAEVLCLNTNLIPLTFAQKVRLGIVHPVFQLLRSIWRHQSKEKFKLPSAPPPPVADASQLVTNKSLL